MKLYDKMKSLLTYFLIRINFLTIISVLFFAISCNTTEPPIIIPPPPVVKDTITVSVESFTHRSISIDVQCTINNVQSSIRIIRELNNVTATIAEYPILVKDTTITDDDNGTGLHLDTTYTYFAVRVDSLGQLKDTSNIVTQKTLAPTSHNYTWQEFTIGDAGFSNALYDVWGTDENNVWAVGTVMINDTAYGVLKWNGSEWMSEKRIGGLQSIYGFSRNDIWAVGGGVWKYDGNSWNSLTQQDAVFSSNIPYTSIWGTSSSNLYLGNAWGKIIQWDGTKAHVVKETGDYMIRDIYGITENFIIAVGRNNSFSKDIVLLFNGYVWQEITNLPINPEAPSSVIMFNSKEIFIAGNKIIFGSTNNWSVMPTTSNIYIDKIRGQSSNSLFAVGSFNEVMHYNGIDWHRYTEISTPTGGRLFGVISIGNKVFAVGHSVDVRAKLLIGSKN